jgi:hypothetical protein
MQQRFRRKHSLAGPISCRPRAKTLGGQSKIIGQKRERRKKCAAKTFGALRYCCSCSHKPKYRYIQCNFFTTYRLGWVIMFCSLHTVIPPTAPSLMHTHDCLTLVNLTLKTGVLPAEALVDALAALGTD